jgi:arginase
MDLGGATSDTVAEVSGWELFGVPYTSMGQPGGIAEASRVLRSVGLGTRLQMLDVHDEGDLSVEAPTGERGASGLLNEPALRSLIAATREAVRRAISHARKALLVGGDCPVILGALAAIREARSACGLVMFDGHEDAWLPSTSATGEASDSELAIALGKVDDGLSRLLDVPLPLVDASRVALLGARDAAEIAAGGASSVRREIALFMDDREVADVGGQAAARAALDAVGDVDVWVHVDLDVLTTDAFAAADYLQPGGLGWKQLDAAFGSAIADDRCRGASVAIYNPDLDPGYRAAESVVDFIARSLAARG